MKYNPSKMTYVVGGALSAFAATPAGATLVEEATGTVADVVTAPSAWDIMVSSGFAASAFITLLWLVKTLLAAIMRGVAAGLRARAVMKQALAAATPGDDDDRAVATSVAVAIAIAEVLDESGRNIPNKGE